MARRPPVASLPGWSRPTGPATWWSSCAITAIRSTRRATTPWPSSPWGRGWGGGGGGGVVATNNVHYATPARQRLATALAAVRARRSLDDMDGWLPAGAAAHLRSGDEQARRFARWPGAVERAAELGRACAFDLSLVAPRLPPFPTPGGVDEMTYLRLLAEDGATRRYGPRGGSDPRGDVERNRKAWVQIDHELAVIEA